MDKADVIQQACLAAAAGQDDHGARAATGALSLSADLQDQACLLAAPVHYHFRAGRLHRPLHRDAPGVSRRAVSAFGAAARGFPLAPQRQDGPYPPGVLGTVSTIDHVVPVACGGANDGSNWVCTSMRSNQIKAHWRLEDLGWTLYPPGDPAQWDGLLAWFRQVIGKYQPLVEQHSLRRRWSRAL